MKRATLTLLIILLFIMAGCHSVPGTVGKGKVETREMSLDLTLTGVDVLGAYDVTIDPSLSGKAVLEGESDILDMMDNTQSEKGVLELAFQPGTTLTTNKTVKARIPAIPGGLLKVSGSGTILLGGDGALKGDTFDVEMDGTGDIDITVDAAAVKITITGAGNITLSGNATSQTVEVSGSGEFRGYKCRGSDVHVNLSGGGNAQVYAGTELTGLISGTGNIFYDGNPPRVDISGTGSGKAMRR